MEVPRSSFTTGAQIGNGHLGIHAIHISQREAIANSRPLRETDGDSRGSVLS